MPHSDKAVCLKIKDIVEKLQRTDCTLLGNKEDGWIMELLFEPGYHRYQLMEWILSKLGFDNAKISGSQNSPEEILKNLQSIISDLGICRQNYQNVIKGAAAIKEQLEFWCILVDSLWLQHEIAMHTSIAKSETAATQKRNCINEEFGNTASVLSSTIETSNIKSLFEPNFQLLDPDVEREAMNISPLKYEMLKIPTLEELKGTPGNELTHVQKLFLKNLNLDEKRDDALSGIELNPSEEKLQSVSTELLSNAQTSFSTICKELKPIISQIKTEEFTDVGEYFKELEPHLDSFLQLKNAIPKLDSSNSKLSEINSNLDDLLTQDSVIKEEKYAKSLKLLKSEN